jgi:hypothetical protein
MQSSGSKTFGWIPGDRPVLNELMAEAIAAGTKPMGLV